VKGKKKKSIHDGDWIVLQCARQIEELTAALEADRDLDEGIKDRLLVLVAAGIETYESCEGGPGHPYAEPTIRFFGERPEGFRALAAILQSEHRNSVRALHRMWQIIDGEPTGPDWEMVFYMPEAL